MKRKIELIILSFVITIAINLLGVVFIGIYNRENISEQILEEKEKLGY